MKTWTLSAPPTWLSGMEPQAPVLMSTRVGRKTPTDAATAKVVDLMRTLLNGTDGA